MRLKVSQYLCDWVYVLVVVIFIIIYVFSIGVVVCSLFIANVLAIYVEVII